jgi:hypothetical protein
MSNTVSFMAGTSFCFFDEIEEVSWSSLRYLPQLIANRLGIACF